MFRQDTRNVHSGFNYSRPKVFVTIDNNPTFAPSLRIGKCAALVGRKVGRPASFDKHGLDGGAKTFEPSGNGVGDKPLRWVPV